MRPTLEWRSKSKTLKLENPERNYWVIGNKFKKNISKNILDSKQNITKVDQTSINIKYVVIDLKENTLEKKNHFLWLYAINTMQKTM